jgi:hypothetical protein
MEIIKKTKTPWYIAGLHFECTQCGNCCSGPEEGVIWISKSQINRLADFLGQSVKNVHKNHLKKFGFRCSIRENPHTKDCIFLVNIYPAPIVPDLNRKKNDLLETKRKNFDSAEIRNNRCGVNGSKGCAIYDVRPTQCRTWPFWPSNLRSPDDWNRAAQKCPGINKGKLYTFDEIEKIKKQ